MSGEDVGTLKATYTADSASFVRGQEAAEKAAKRLETQVKKLADELSGGRAQRGMDVLEKAVERAGGTAKLSEAALAKVESRIRSLSAAGAQVPASLQGLNQQLSNTDKLLGALKGGFTEGLGVGAGFGAVTAAVTGVVAAIKSVPEAGAAAAKAWIEEGSALNDLSTQTQVAVGTLQELQFAARQSSVGGDELLASIEKTKRAMIDAPEKFRTLGLSVEELLQKDPGEAFAQVAAKIASIENPAQRTAAAMDLWGKKGGVILRMAGDLVELRARAEELGVSFDEHGVKAADALGDALGELDYASTNLRNALVQIVADNPELVSFLQDIATSIGGVAKAAHDGKGEVQDLLAALKTVAQYGLLGTGAQGLVNSIDQARSAARVTATLARGAQTYLAENPAPRADQQGIFNPPSPGAVAPPSDKDTEGLKKVKDAWDDVREAQLRASGTLSDHLKIVDLHTQKRIREAEELKDVSVAIKVDLIRALQALGEAEKAAALAADRPSQALKELAARGIRGIPDQPDTLLTRDQPVFGAQKGYEPLLKPQIDFMGPRDPAQIAKEEKERLDEIDRKYREVEDSTRRWQQALAAVADTFQLLGISADSFLGRTLGGLQSLSAATGILKEGMFNKATGESSIGNLFKGGFSNVLTNVSGALSAGIAAFSIGKAIFGLFHKSEAEKAAEEAGRHLGIKVSESLGKEISKQAKDLHISIGDAALLNITKAAAESGRSIASFAPQLGQLMQLIAKGGPAAAVGMQELGKAWTELEKEAEGGSRAAQQSLTLLLLQSEKTGVRLKEITDYVKREVESGGKGLAGVFSALAQETDTSKQRLDLYGGAAVSYFQALQAQGLTLTEIFAIMGDAIDQAAAAYEKLGLEVPPALAEIIAKRDVLADNKPLMAIIEGSRAVLESLDHLGRLSADQLKGIAQDTQTQYEDLVKAFEDKGFESAAAQAAALEVLAPNLMLLRDLAKEYGIELDANTQAMINQAEQAGLFDKLKTPQQEMVDLQKEQIVLLGLLVEAMGVELPAAIKAAIEEWKKLNQEAGKTPHPGSGPDSQPNSENAPDYNPKAPGGDHGGAAHGAVGHFGSGTSMTLHGHEVVTPVRAVYTSMADIVARRVASMVPDMSGAFGLSAALQAAAGLTPAAQGAASSGGQGSASSSGSPGAVHFNFRPEISPDDPRAGLRRFKRWLDTDEDQIVGDMQRALARAR